MNRVDLQQLAGIRIVEASALLTLPVPMPDGAYYLAGYAVECGLKACIAKGYGPESWPEKEFVVKCHTHEIFALIRHAGLEAALNVAVAVNPAILTNLKIVKYWSESSRYGTPKLRPKAYTMPSPTLLTECSHGSRPTGNATD